MSILYFFRSCKILNPQCSEAVASLLETVHQLQEELKKPKFNNEPSDDSEAEKFECDKKFDSLIIQLKSLMPEISEKIDAIMYSCAQ